MSILWFVVILCAAVFFVLLWVLRTQRSSLAFMAVTLDQKQLTRGEFDIRLESLSRRVSAPEGSDVDRRGPERIAHERSGLLGGQLPSKMYVGNSAQINLMFPWESQQEGSSLGEIRYLFDVSQLQLPSLELELQAAAFAVDGDKIQRYELHQLPLTFSWNIAAKSSGDFEIGFVTRVYQGPDQDPQVATMNHRLRVVKLGFLTAQQLWIITGLFGTVSAAFGLLQTLISLGLVKFP